MEYDLHINKDYTKGSSPHDHNERTRD